MNYGCHGGHCCCLSSFCGSSERRCTSRTVQLPCLPSHRRSSFVLPCAFQMYVGQGKETNVNNAKGSAESADAFRWKYGNAVVCGLSHDHMGLKTTTAVCPSSQTCTILYSTYELMLSPATLAKSLSKALLFRGDSEPKCPRTWGESLAHPITSSIPATTPA